MSTQRLSRGTNANLLAGIASVLVVVPGLPVLIQRLGKERFGIFSLFLTFAALTAVLNLGLGKAITKHYASLDASDRERTVEPHEVYVFSTIVSQVVVSLPLCLTISWFAANLADIMNVSTQGRLDAIAAIRLFAWMIPLQFTSSTFRGVLEGTSGFAKLAWLDASATTLNYLGPILCLIRESSLTAATQGLVLGRLLSLLMLVVIATRHVEFSFSRARWSLPSIRELLSFGWWSSVIDGAMLSFAYADRLILARMAGLSVLTPYVIAQEAIGKFWLLPTSLTRVVFPKFASATTRTSARQVGLLRTSYGWMLQVPLTVLVVGELVANDVFRLWLRTSYAEDAARLAKVMMVGAALNSFAMIHSACLLAKGQVRARAQVVVFEAIALVVLASLFIPRFGAIGAAWAWSGRVLATWIVTGVLLRRCGISLASALPPGLQVLVLSQSGLLIVLASKATAPRWLQIFAVLATLASVQLSRRYRDANELE